MSVKVLYPSAQVVVGYMSTIGSHLLQYAKLLGNLGRYDKMQGWYNISYNRFIKLLNIHEAVLGKEHPDTLTSMNNLAGVLDSQGKYDEAEAMFQQVLGLRETETQLASPTYAVSPPSDFLTYTSAQESAPTAAGIFRSSQKPAARKLRRDSIEVAIDVSRP
jgi:tetratricopeptide (TPR) repeat protein